MLVPQLPNIMPIEIQPVGNHGLSSARNLLAKIDRIRIQNTIERNGISYYIVDIYLYHSDCRIPSNLHLSALRRTSNQHSHHTMPDYQVERKYSDFRMFRKALQSYRCRNNHIATSICELCIAIEDYMERELHQPRKLFKSCTPIQYKKAMLSWYINNFIAFAQQHINRVHLCNATEGLLQLLERMLQQEAPVNPPYTT